MTIPLVGTKMVWSAPAPRNVTFVAPLKEILPVALLYVPAPRETTPPPLLEQLEMAELICAEVALDVRVEQMFVRFGIPPTTPALLQSIARLGANTPLHGV